MILARVSLAIPLKACCESSGSSSLHHWPTSDVKGSKDRVDDLRTWNDVRELRTQAIVENLPNQSTITEDAASDGHWYRLSFREHTPQNNFREPGEFRARIGEYGTRGGVALIGSRDDSWHQCGKVRTWSRVGNHD
jgi:hypothetical protein